MSEQGGEGYQLLKAEVDAVISTIADRIEVGTSGEDVSVLRLRMKLLTNLVRRLETLMDGEFSFRFNQLRALKDVRDFLMNDECDLKGLIQQPTGAGKTAMFGVLTWLFDVNTLILVPNKNLLHQTKDELMKLFGFAENEIGLVGDSRTEVGRKVTIATYSSHIARHRSRGAYAKFTGSIPLVICDEAHTALGDRTQGAIARVVGDDSIGFDEGEADAELEFLDSDVFRSRDALLLGFTATPKLRSKRAVDYFGKLISRVRMAELMKAGILKKIRSHLIAGSLTVEEEAGYISEEREVSILDREDIYRKLLGEFTSFRADGTQDLRTAVYCANTTECEKFAQIAREEFGLESIIVTSRIGADRLKEAESKLLSGEIDFIVTVEKLAAGWNFPPLNSVILARATNSPVRIIQPVGRASRAYLDEEYAHVFETHWTVSSGTSSSEREGSSGVASLSERSSTASRNALLLAQAFAEIGENPHDIIDGIPEDMQFEISVYLDESGVGQFTIDDRVIDFVSLNWIANRMCVSDDSARIRLQSSGVVQEYGYFGRINGAGQRYPLYNLSAVLGSFEQDLAVQVLELNEHGRVTIEMEGENVELSSIQGFAESVGYSFSGMWGRIQGEGVQPISGYVAKVTNFISLYRLADLERCYGQRVMVEQGGVGVWIMPSGESVTVSTIPEIARRYNLSGSSVRNRLAKKDMQPLDGVTDVNSTAVYSFELVRTLFEPVELNEEGRGTTYIDGSEVGVISMHGIARALGISFGGASAKVKREGKLPVPNVYAKSGVQDIKLFRISDFPELI